MNLIKGKTIANVSLAVVALSLVTAGCASKPKPVAWNVSIAKATPASIEADVVGVSASDKPYWMNSVKPDDYWKANNSVRKGAKKISKILETGTPWVIEKDNPIWNDWFSYGATELMIMANLPGGGDNSPFDRRRVFVPLDKNAWLADKDKTLKIEVQDQFIRVLTPQKPRD
jgi:hypothetical protein